MSVGALLAAFALALVARRIAEELLGRLACVFVLLQAGLPLRRRRL